MRSAKAIVLASASPRRRDILAKAGLSFRVDASDYHEKMERGLSPRALARRLSYHKAVSVASRHKNAVIIAADTFIVFGDRIFGKPRSAADARKILKALQGKRHSVITGFTIMDASTKKKLTRSVETRVYFRKMSPAEINGYVCSREPLDKAGAYAIQGLGAAFIRKIEGDYDNVVGLPLTALMNGLKKFGIGVSRPVKRTGAR